MAAEFISAATYVPAPTPEHRMGTSFRKSQPREGEQGRSRPDERKPEVSAHTQLVHVPDEGNVKGFHRTRHAKAT
jgi:hypothetical protein